MKKTTNKNTELAIKIIENYGFRVEELYSLNHNNIDFENNIIKLNLKGTGVRKIEIKPGTVDILKEFLEIKNMGNESRNIKIDIRKVFIEKLKKEDLR